MNYILRGHDRNNAIHDMLICLLPDEAHSLVLEESGGDICISTFKIKPDGSLAAYAFVRRDARETHGECLTEPPQADDEELKRACGYAVKTALFRALTPLLDAPPVWGSLTGVKPTKPVRAAIEAGLPEAGAAEYLQREYFVARSRAELCVRAAKYALEAQRKLEPFETQLYVGIPFCPTRCSYCSFVSQDTQRSGALIEPYLDALLREISAAGKICPERKIGSLYIGGGTPTVLSAQQLDELLSALWRAFDLSNCREITVEAGRPETLDEDKLQVLSCAKVTRISINPQTMNDEILHAVGRHHTAQDTVRAYKLARKAGDFAINMDLIAGLPGDDAEGFLKSVETLVRLAPENITIHSLALKKGAAMRFGARGVLDVCTLDAAYDMLERAQYTPYYLYRQKYTAGGLENVGFCRDGFESHYNICMMEELCDVLALGAGAVSKLCTQSGEKIRRIGNPKYPREYIAAADEIALRKLAFLPK